MAAVLADAQRVAGHDSRHLWAVDSTLWSRPLTAPLHTVAAGIDHFIIRDGDFDAPISLVRDKLRWKIPEFVAQADVIHLHNVNGITQVGELARSFPDKKIVWTLHDMNSFTGACHYALGCSKYIQDCSSCPAVKVPFQGLVEKSFLQKLAGLDAVENLHLVAPSKWLADESQASRLMSRFSTSTIRNPLNPEFFAHDTNTGSVSHTFVVVAQNLEDPVKNVSAAVMAFSDVRREHPAATMALVGRGGSPFAGEGITLLGPLPQSDLAATLRASQAIVVPSAAENAPMVIAEAAAQGCLPIVRATGGMPGMIADLGAGHSFSHSEEMTIAMATILRQKASEQGRARQALRAKAQSLYSPEAVRKQYDEVYNR